MHLCNIDDATCQISMRATIIRPILFGCTVPNAILTRATQVWHMNHAQHTPTPTYTPAQILNIYYHRYFINIRVQHLWSKIYSFTHNLKHKAWHLQTIPYKYKAENSLFTTTKIMISKDQNRINQRNQTHQQVDTDSERAIPLNPRA